MNFYEVIIACQKKSIQLGVRKDKLVVKDPDKQLTEELRDGLREFKTEILSWLSDSQTEQSERIVRKPDSLTEIPLSFAQQRLWLIDALSNGSPQYNVPIALRVQGEFSSVVLEQALESLVARHEILRTCYHQGNDGPYQCISDNVKSSIKQVDLSIGSANNTLPQLVHLEFRKPFDLSNDRMIRCTLFKLAEREFVLVIVIHHIACDGLSMQIITREFMSLYERIANNSPAGLAKPQIQYADYAYWQRCILPENTYDKGLSYWLKQLTGIPELHSLPLDHLRPLQPNNIGGVFEQKLDAKLIQQANQFARRHNASLFMVLYSAFVTVLARWSGQKDIVVGIPSSGRNNPQLNDMIGFFVNTLVYRSQLSNNCSFSELVEKSRITAFEASAHESVPFDLLVEKLGQVRSKGYAPVCQVTFTMQGKQLNESLKMSSVSLSRYGSEADTIKFDLQLSITESINGAYVVWRYATALFESTTVARISKAFKQILLGGMAQPETSVFELEMLDKEQNAKILKLSKGLKQNKQRNCTLSQSFSVQAGLSPDAIAVRSVSGYMTYQSLANKSGRLANHLQDQGVDRGDIVVIYCSRSIELIVAQLAIMKSGATYLPIDPEIQKERLAYILSDTHAQLVLSLSSLASSIPVAGVDVLYLDGASDQEQWLQEYSTNHCIDKSELDALAYLIYTSGSTGNPKGVEIAHNSVTDYCAFALRSYYSSELKGSIVVTSPAFDLTVPSLYLPLMTGGCVELLDNEDELTAFSESMIKDRNSLCLIRATPTHIRSVLGLLPDSPLSGKFVFVIGGEAFPSQLAAELQHRFPLSQIFNHYGPTEATVGCSLYAYDKSRNYSLTIPIGQPMENTKLYVLDKHQKLSPIGVPGELYIGGDGLATGYHGLADQTDQAFVTDPFDNHGRLYKTGDLVRWLTRGELEFIGRTDKQIKLRGYRIELGEIETILRRQESVKDAIVLPTPDNESLLAYVALDQAVVPVSFNLSAAIEAGQYHSETFFDLPNGMAVRGLNQTETLYLYDELMVRDSYLKHGVEVKNGDCILDVGANIGMFSLSLLASYTELKLYAFEPIPEIFEALSTNAELYGNGQMNVQCVGLSSESGLAAFHYYPNVSLFSGMITDDQQNIDKVKSYLSANDQHGDSLVNDLMDEMLEDRLQKNETEVVLSTLSEQIIKHNIETIDLLKIDVERSELKVLQGIEDNDWPRIRQIVMEVNNDDDNRQLLSIQKLLEAKGFQVAYEKNQQLKNTALVNLFATRAKALEQNKSPHVAVPNQWLSRPVIETRCMAALRENLPAYMVPNKIILLSELPKSGSGKVDLKALPVWDSTETELVQAESDTEKRLAEIWADILERDEVGVTAGFFELGGNSLLATRIASQIAKQLGKKIPVRIIFDNNTIRALGHYLDQLKHFQYERIPLVAKGQQLPLSFAQQRLWFIDQIDGSTQYNLPVAIKLTGKLNPSVIEHCLHHIIERHEVLRTTFDEVDGQPVQVVHNSWSNPVELKDVSGLPDPTQAATSLATSEAGRPFDLSQDLMLRCMLIKIAEGHHVILFNMHHIASDGWSIGVLVKEFMSLYEAEVAGKEISLPELPVQFSDYACWQRSVLENDVQNQELDYWKAQLSGIPLVHSLPLDYVRPLVQSYEAGVIRHNLNAKTVQALKVLSERVDGSFFMVLQSAFALFLGRWTHNNDVVMGTPISGRNHKDVEALIGCFINNLVLRTQLQSQMSFMELLAQNREMALDAFAHQTIPFEMLVDELCQERDLRFSPLFQIKFVLQNYESQNLKLTNLDVETFASGTSVVHFDLDLTAIENDSGLQLNWTYRTELFEQITVERMAVGFGCLLDNLIANPELNIQNYKLLGDDTKSSLLSHHVKPVKDYMYRNVVTSFEAQVSKKPLGIAAICGEKSLTYLRLNELANQLARYLLEEGVGSESCVGLCADGSLEMLVGLLGITKSGAAYVPLDAAHPTARLGFILNDAGIELLLTRSDLLDSLPVSGVDVVLLDGMMEDSQSMIEYSTQNLAVSIQPNQLAYVLYTSGSTGDPKGVCVEHAQLSSYLEHCQKQYFNDSLKGAVVSTPLSFDATITSTLAPLSSGRSVRLLPAGQSDLLEALNECLFSLKSNWLFKLTPSHLNGLAALSNEQRSEQRHLLVIGGEQLSTGLLEKWKTNYLPEALFINEYGPTETVVGCCTNKICQTSEVGKGPSVAIGRAIDNVQLLVMDDQQSLLPEGMVGELYIGGLGVARGYLNQPELTAERFIDSSQASNGRLYRTGDLVRWLADEKLEFLGRVDDQIKLRGYRIELGEIESHLSAIAGVRAAAVTVTGTEDDARLVGYVVIDDEILPKGDISFSLNQQMVTKVPEYMLPMTYVCLEQIPLTANGKLDRLSLPVPNYKDDNKFVAAQTDLEHQLLEIWSPILKIDSISTTSSFFALGGHSLLATRVVAAIATKLSRIITVRALFDHPTIRSLAAYLETVDSIIHMRIPSYERNGELPLSFAQQRLWFIDQLESGSAQYNIPRALTLKGNLEHELLVAALQALVERHEVFRTTFTMNSGEGAQLIHPSRDLEFPIVDLRDSEAPQKQARILVQEQAKKLFDLQNQFGLRCTLLQTGDTEHILVIVVHHLIFDDWSSTIFVEELSQLYSAFLRKESNPLKPLPIQYADFAHWQRRIYDENRLDAEVNYWCERLRGAPHTHSLATDFNRPKVAEHHANSMTLALDPEITCKLKLLAEHHDMSLFMVLETAFAVLIGRLSGQQDIVIGTPIAGRDHPDIESLIGFFVNTIVLRTELSQEQSFDSLLISSRKHILDSFAHQTLPFERLVDELKPERTFSHSPIFQIMFALQTAQQGDGLQLPELQVGLMSTGYEVAKYDLRVTAFDRGDSVAINWLYATSLFKPETIQGFADNYAELLRSVAENSKSLIYELNLLTITDKRIWKQLNDTNVELPPVKTIHQWFQQQAEQTPEYVAVKGVGGECTYRELNVRSNQLAAYILEMDLADDPIIALCLNRSTDLIVGMLAALKAQAAFVIIDPDFPLLRKQMIINDCKAQLLISESHFELKACPVRTIELDCSEVEYKLGRQPVHNRIEHQQKAEQLCYVCYTSGTSNKPKGVAVTHRSLIAYVSYALKSYYQDHLDGSLVVTSPAFDITMPSLILPLLSGGCVELLPAEDIINELASATSRLTGNYLLRMTPTHVRSFLPIAHRVSDARHAFVIGGEVLDPKLATTLQHQFTGSDLYNHYGPTEAVIGCSIHHINRSNIGQSRVIPIGRPMDNVQLYVLDQNMLVLPMGAVGELYIGGVGIAEGYLGQPDLTEQVFIANPFSEGERLYRSGDLVRLSTEGELEFVGRVDLLMKVRGFRVDPTEVEYWIRRSSEVENVLVKTFTDIHNDQQLVAYIIPTEQIVDESALTDGLFKSLKLNLPSYMIPSRVVMLDQLPLTPNGKVDLKALPAPTSRRPEESVAPETEIEKGLAQIWSDLLDVEQIGIHCDFFTLGGHSLLATRVVNALKSSYQKSISVRAIFEHRTIFELARYIDEFGQQDHRAIPVASRDQPLPLSFAQHRLWFIDRLYGQSTHYNQTRTLRLQGELDIVALQQALDALVKRHEVLRTNFEESSGEGVQIIHDVSSVQLTQVSFGLLTDREQHLQSWIQKEKQLAFDLSCDQMIRCALIKLQEHEHILVFTVHHIASDGWSTGILVKDFMALYNAFCLGQPNPLEPLPIQYADYALWQRSTQTEQLQKELAFWCDCLKGAPTVHSLPLDFTRPKKQDYNAGLHVSRIDSELLANINQIADRHDATLFMLLQATLALLIGSYSGQDDILVGTPIAGRTHKDTEKLVGHFLNNLVFRTRLDQDVTFSQLLKSVRDYALDAYANQSVPFEMLVDHLNPERSLEHSPVFQIKFVLQNYAVPKLNLTDIEISPVEDNQHIVHFDLDLTATEHANGVALQWTYKKDLFLASTIERLALGFSRLLKGISLNTDQAISSYSILSKPERQSLLQLGKTSAGNDPYDKTIVEQFCTQAQKTPDLIAVRCGESLLSYQQLQVKSSRLANYLRELEVGPEDTVGIFCSRSVELIIGMLAVLKTGAAYVPIDPQLGYERLAGIIKDSKIEVILSHSKLVSELPVSGLDFVQLDDAIEDAQWLKEYDDPFRIELVKPDSLAYVIYTSGSTGLPKGVEVSHRSLANYCAFGLSTYYDQHLHGSLVVTSHSFDITLPSLLLPLLKGGCVELMQDQADLEDVARMLSMPDKSLLLRMTPSHVRSLLDLLPDKIVTARSVFVIGGESLKSELANRLSLRFPRSRIFNHYGPTEAVIGCTFFEYKTGQVMGHSVPIGTPMTNTQVYVLDRHQQPCPVGVPGELYVGGYLATGYRNQPELTAERFSELPIEPGSRLYRTGDLVRWRPDHNLEFCGRVDQQVKIRGYRIEPGEVETVIQNMRFVRTAVVVAKEFAEEVRLIAYVVPQSKDDSIDGVVDQVKRGAYPRLPSYMRPSAIVVLAELPLTLNGKVNLAELPDPNYPSDAEIVMPESEHEVQMHEIWARLLALESISVTSDFFELGGHSLLAARLVTEIREVFTVELPLRKVFDLKTIRALTEFCIGQQSINAVEQSFSTQEVTEEGWL